MKTTRLLWIAFLLVAILGWSHQGRAEEPFFKGYEILVVKDLEVNSNTPAPESAGSQIAEKVVYQLKRYSQKYKLFDTILKEGSKDAPQAGKILLLQGTVKEYTPPTLGRRIGRSFIPGGEFTGTAVIGVHYQFVDQESGKVVYETDLRTTSSGSHVTIEYAMERNGEALAKTIIKYRGK